MSDVKATWSRIFCPLTIISGLGYTVVWVFLGQTVNARGLFLSVLVLLPKLSLPLTMPSLQPPTTCLSLKP